MALLLEGAISERGVPCLLLAQEDAAGNVQWFLADHEGSVRDVVGLVSGNWQVVSHITYTSFGAVITHSGDVPRFAFAGRELDGETDLYYNRHRYYDAGTGRFLSEDPSGFGGGDDNLYRYVGNSPLNFRDPMGLYGRPSPEESQAMTAKWQQEAPGLLDGGTAMTTAPSSGYDSERGFQAVGESHPIGPVGMLADRVDYEMATEHIPEWQAVPRAAFFSLVENLPVLRPLYDAWEAQRVYYDKNGAHWSKSGWCARLQDTCRAVVDIGFIGTCLSLIAPKYGATPGGRPFTKHYGTETGPQRNIPGSVVDNTISTTEGIPGTNGTTVHYDPVNDVTAVTGEGDSIVSVHRGPPPKGQ